MKLRTVFPTAVNLHQEEDGPVEIHIHGLNRTDFDALPGAVSHLPRKEEGGLGDYEFWAKVVSPTLTVYTEQPPTEQPK